jgi:uracil-DNA glycosylase
MTHEFCPGYNRRPYSGLVLDYPGAETYPAADFRVEWGPVFHRGRLDGSARVVVLGQDPAQHETIARRILVGEAGQRVQGLMAKLGLSRSYVMVNTFLYSVYGQGGGERHRDDPAIAAYRNRWLDALTRSMSVTAVVTLGTLAAKAYDDWAATRPTVAARLHHAVLRHPTAPESASGGDHVKWLAATKDLLKNWNAALPALYDAVEQEAPTPLKTYGSGWRSGDLVEIPERDLPAGSPAWMRSLEPWADRVGRTAETKRATIVVTVPVDERPWHEG